MKRNSKKHKTLEKTKCEIKLFQNNFTQKNYYSNKNRNNKTFKK